VEGTVDLYVEIGLDGLASGIWVQRGLGYGLDEKAIEAVRQWRFQPGMRNGEPVTGTATIEVQFQMFHSPPRR
jgi:TonB family protein